MEDLQDAAWIEGADAQKLPVSGNLSIGRASTNQIVLQDEKISRRHAAIHQQAHNEYWLIDLGSRNGVSLNGRRIAQSTRLRDADIIQIGGHRFVFRHPGSSPRAPTVSTQVERTVSDIKPADCWLVLLDIEASTHLSQKHSPEQLPAITGRWLEQCRGIIEGEGGAIDKFLGDGFMAFWHSASGTDASVMRVLAALKRVREDGAVPFRTVVHFGRVFSGGATASGVERFFGPEINYLFKMESVAKGIRLPNVISSSAWEQMADKSSFREAGEHEVPGFEGRHTFYTL